jgi:hypothetical protein
MTHFIRINETQFEKHELGEVWFVPLFEDKTKIQTIPKQNGFITLNQCIVPNILFSSGNKQ